MIVLEGLHMRVSVELAVDLEAWEEERDWACACAKQNAKNG